jgi:very-short-patch-repair endonuclease
MSIEEVIQEPIKTPISYKSQTYYTKQERLIKRHLDKLGFIEGIGYIHNTRIRRHTSERTIYYWLDFYIPSMNLVIEYSPNYWHKDKGRAKLDINRRNFVISLGLKYVELNDEHITKIKSDGLLSVIQEMLNDGSKESG